MAEQILKARDNETGSIVKFKWYEDRPPTEQDLAIIFEENRKTSQPSLLRSLDKKLRGITQGVVEAAVNTALGIPATVASGYENLFNLGVENPEISGIRGGVQIPSGTLPGAISTLGGLWRPSPTGQAITEYNPLALAGKGITWAGEKGAEFVTEKTGSPLAGTAVGTGIEMAPQLLGLRGTKSMKFSPKEQMAIDLYKKGVPVGKGAFIEKMAEKVPPGNLFFRKQRKEINEAIINSNKQFVTEELGLPSPQIKPQLKEITQKAWNEFNESLPATQKVRMPELEKWINDNLSALPKTKEFQPLIARLSNVIGEMIDNDGFVSWDKVTKINPNIWSGKKYIRSDPAMKHTLGKLSEALGNDFDFLQQNTGTMAVPKVGELYANAMEKSQLGHRVTLAAEIEKLFNDKRVMSFDVEKGVGIFNPSAFKTLVEQNMGRLRQMSPKGSNIPTLVSEWADKMMYIADSQAKYAKQLSTGGMAAEIGRQAVGGGLLSSVGKYVSPETAGMLAVPWGFETWMAHSLAHPRGWLKQWVMRETSQRIPSKLIAVGEAREIPRQFDEYGLPAQ